MLETKRCGCRVYRNRQPEGFTVVALVCGEARRLKLDAKHYEPSVRDAAEVALQKARRPEARGVEAVNAQRLREIGEEIGR